MQHFNHQEPPVLSVKQVIGMAGGATDIMKASNGLIKQNATIAAWNKIGIPWKYWCLLISLTGLEVEKLHNANIHALQQNSNLAVGTSQPPLGA